MQADPILSGDVRWSGVTGLVPSPSTPDLDVPDFDSI
jgi:hypothetical protein